ncbi:MAG: hypothetical protein H7039_12945 [Bryobacteraceae bacterium]|nr:hypothetical protein [Bryobacteraceae bacterium]
MDIRTYFYKVHETERTLASLFVVVISNETQDGGKAGHAVEVARDVAAHMIVDGRARVATEAEAEEFRQEQSRNTARAEEVRAASSLKVTILTEDGMRALQHGGKQRG